MRIFNKNDVEVDNWRFLRNQLSRGEWVLRGSSLVPNPSIVAKLPMESCLAGLIQAQTHVWVVNVPGFENKGGVL